MTWAPVRGFLAEQTYTYDELNRLKSATENGTPNGGSSAPTWKQTYLYDRFGNRTFDTSGSNTTPLPPSFNANIFNPTINPANNQFNTGQDYDYDPAGNVVEDAAGKKFNYDGENKQTSFGTGGSLTNGGTYFYDGDGHRVKKVIGTELTVFAYDAAGQLVAEFATIAPSSPQLSYLTSDTLGTPRMNTNLLGAVVARHDYFPFGDEIETVGNRSSAVSYNADDVRKKFTGQERDIESDLDYFHARYYRAKLGRVTSPDPMLLSLRPSSPQTMNRYAYVLNNPLRYVDPSGLYEWDASLKDDANLDKKERERRANLRKAFMTAKSIARSEAYKALLEGRITDAKFQEISKSLDSYGADPGTANSDNGVTVGVGPIKKGNLGETDTILRGNTKDMTYKTDILVRFDEKFLLGDNAKFGVVHEGTHVEDVFNWAGRAKNTDDPLDKGPTEYMTESHAFTVQSYFAEALGKDDKKWGLWQKSWANLDKQKPGQEASVRQIVVDSIIQSGYGWSPSNQGPHKSSRLCNVCPAR